MKMTAGSEDLRVKRIGVLKSNETAIVYIVTFYGHRRTMILSKTDWNLNANWPSASRERLTFMMDEVDDSLIKYDLKASEPDPSLNKSDDLFLDVIQERKDQSKCTCNIADLMSTGCKCGGA